jgi:hypothetical protein
MAAPMQAVLRVSCIYNTVFPSLTQNLPHCPAIRNHLSHLTSISYSMFNITQEKALHSFVHDKSLHYSFPMREENVAAKLLTFLLCIYKAQLRISVRPTNQERFVISVSSSKEILQQLKTVQEHFIPWLSQFIILPLSLI